MTLKRPESVLVVIHGGQGDAADGAADAPCSVLMMDRANRPGYWQSVTGSLEPDELPVDAAQREVFEETGLVLSDAPITLAEAREHPERRLGRLCHWQLSQLYQIFPEWQHRYGADVHVNREHLFSLQVSPDQPICLSREHLSCRWLPWYEAAAYCFSWSNRHGILAVQQQFNEQAIH